MTSIYNIDDFTIYITSNMLRIVPKKNSKEQGVIFFHRNEGDDIKYLEEEYSNSNNGPLMTVGILRNIDTNIYLKIHKSPLENQSFIELGWSQEESLNDSIQYLIYRITPNVADKLYEIFGQYENEESENINSVIEYNTNNTNNNNENPNSTNNNNAKSVSSNVGSVGGYKEKRKTHRKKHSKRRRTTMRR
jgi:hypothetical protein